MTTDNGLVIEAFLKWIAENQGPDARRSLEAFIRAFPTPQERGVFVRGLPEYQAFISGAAAPAPAREVAITTPGRARVAEIERARAAQLPPAETPLVDPVTSLEEEELQAIIGRLQFHSSNFSFDPETGKFYVSSLAFGAVPFLSEVPREKLDEWN